MRGVPRRRLKRAFNNGGDLIVVDCARTARTFFVQKAFNSVLQKASPPFSDGVLMNAQFGGYHLAGQSSGTAKYDPAAFGKRPRYAMTPDLSFEIRSLVGGENDRFDGTACCIRHVVAPKQSIRATIIL
jgi:hypothetical protein